MPRPSLASTTRASRSASPRSRPSRRTPEDIERLLSAREGRYPTVVVERGGEVVAWASAGSYRSRPCYDPIAEHSVYVDRAHRGTGVGRLALEALIAEAEQRGFLKLVSRIFPENVPVSRFTARSAFGRWGSTAVTASSTASGATASSSRSSWAKRPSPEQPVLNLRHFATARSPGREAPVQVGDPGVPELPKRLRRQTRASAPGAIEDGPLVRVEFRAVIFIRRVGVELERSTLMPDEKPRTAGGQATRMPADELAGSSPWHFTSRRPGRVRPAFASSSHDAG